VKTDVTFLFQAVGIECLKKRISKEKSLASSFHMILSYKNFFMSIGKVACTEIMSFFVLHYLKCTQNNANLVSQQVSSGENKSNIFRIFRLNDKIFCFPEVKNCLLQLLFG